MSKLTADEFFKLPNAKRPDRRKILLDAINSNRGLEVYLSGNKETVMVFPKAKNANAIRQIESLKIGDKTTFSSIKLVGSDGKPYKISDIKKSKDFGGGGGSRGGSDLTALTESGQCYVASLVFNIKKKAIKWEDLTHTDLMAAAKYVDTGKTTLDNVLDESPPEWVQSYVKVANYIFANYKMKSGKPVYFHRDSGFHKKIFEYKKECLAADKASQTPQAPGSFGDDKWNPGDIWMTTFGKAENSLPKLPSDSWSALNKEIYNLAGKGSSTNRELLGVSLKKIERAVKASEYNVPGTKKSTYKFNGFVVSPERISKGQLPFFSSIDCYLYIGDGRVQFRATSGSASKPSWQGEISGSTAAGGKVGGGNVNIYLKNNYREGMFRDSESELVSKVNTPAFWTDFYEMYKKLFKNQNFIKYNKSEMGEMVSESDFKKLAIARAKDTESFIISKYMCMKMIDIMLSNLTKLDSFSTDIFLYGASNTNQSSYFVKIYE
jgi:hypothetical protein